MSKVINNKDVVFGSNQEQTEGFKTFLYNPSTGAVLGRTAGSWAKILIFYVIFYTCLAILFSFCMWLFMKTLSNDGPKWYLDESLIGSSPGLGYRPMSTEHEESTLIWYKSGSKNHKNWTEELDSFLAEYQDKVNESNVVDCTYKKGRAKGNVCRVNVNEWKPCVSSNKYDYPNGRPCVFIKLNKILNWVPDYYDDPNNLPNHMPKDLKKYIKEKGASDPKELKTVWVSCEGENPADKENIGVIDYHPYRGFPGFYFPFVKTKNYVSPLVALHFKSITKGVLVNVECKAWAGNIMHDRRDRVGLVHFELLVD